MKHDKDPQTDIGSSATGGRTSAVQVPVAVGYKAAENKISKYSQMYSIHVMYLCVGEKVSKGFQIAVRRTFSVFTVQLQHVEATCCAESYEQKHN